MSVLSPSRCISLALAAALNTACAQGPSSDKAETEAAMTENPAESRTLDGYTYTTKPVVAEFGPHRFAFPANYYDDQIGPATGGGVGLTLMWPGLQAAPPGTRPTRSMADHYRAVGVLIDYVDAVPIAGLLERIASTEAITPEGSVTRRDPTRRLDLRIPKPPQFGITPYVVDEMKMANYSRDYLEKLGELPTRNPQSEKDWYVEWSSDGKVKTLIRCGQSDNGLDGLVVEGDLLVPDGARIIADCMHDIVDLNDSISMTIRYPRVLLKDWKAIEDAVRTMMARYRIR